MEGGGSNSETNRDRNSSSRRYRFQLSASNFLRSPITAILEYSGLLRPLSNSHESESLIPRHSLSPSPSVSVQDTVPNEGEVSIRIIGAGEGENDRVDSVGRNCGGGVEGTGGLSSNGVVAGQEGLRSERGMGEGVSSQFSSSSGEAEVADVSGAGNRESTYQRYDIQQAARWIEQVLPFSLLLLVVFIRQHLQGFFVTIWIAVFMFKSNDILRKQTALKEERKVPILIGICILFTLHVTGVYWWYRNDDLLYPLILLPPKDIPPKDIPPKDIPKRTCFLCIVSLVK